MRSEVKAAGLSILSITTCNGEEFADDAAIAQTLGWGFHFADPKAPHQHGTNEERQRPGARVHA